MAVQAAREQEERVDPTRPSMDEILEAELAAGLPLPDGRARNADGVLRKAHRSGVKLDKAPFTRLIKLLCIEEEREGHTDAKARVALRCGVDVSRIDTYLKGETVDENTVEQVLNYLGTRTMSDLYPVGPLRIAQVRDLIEREDAENPAKLVAARLGVPLKSLLAYLSADEQVPWRNVSPLLPACRRCSPYCHAPGCEQHCQTGRAWCEKHADVLDRVKEALKEQRQRVRKRIGREDSRPQCTAVGCEEPRTPPRAFCDACQIQHEMLENDYQEEQTLEDSYQEEEETYLVEA